MDCEQLESLLSPYLEGDLDDRDRRVLETHLGSCRTCAQLLAQMRDVSASLRSLPELDISPRLRQRLLTIPAKKRLRLANLDFLIRPSFQPVLTAATVVLTLLSFYAFSPQRSDINKSIERQVHLGYQAIGKLYTRAESLTSTLAGYKENLMITLQSHNPLREENR